MALKKCPMLNLRLPHGRTVLPLAGKVATTYRHSQRVAVPTDPDRKGQTPVNLAPLPSEVQEALTLPRPPIPPHPHHPNTKGLPHPGGQGREKPRGQEGKALLAFTSPEAIDPGHPQVTVDQVKHHQMQAPLAVEKGERQEGKGASLLQGDPVQDHQGLVFSWPGAGLFPLPAWPGGWARGSYAGSGGLGLAVLGPGLAMALEEQEAQGFEGIPRVGAWQEGQDG